ncbi:MAG: tetratricopeptide repeat protein [Myxococcales bacterium]
MQGREELTLDQAMRRASSAGTLVRHEAVAVFLEVLRLAAESRIVPDAATTVLGEDGSLTFPSDGAAASPEPAEAIRAAGRLAAALFGAAGVEAPLALAGAAESAPERFPTVRHLRDAFELDLLLSGTPPPTEVERRMAIAALVAKARQLRGTSAGPPARRAEARAEAAPAADPSARITEPPAPVVRWRPPRWLPLVAAGGLGLLAGVLLDREPSRPSQVAVPAPAALVPEIPLPAVDTRAAPAVVDPRPPARAAPAAGGPSAEPASRPVRKLRRHVAPADAAATARAKLQMGDESLKQGRFFEALMAFREALDQDPPVPAAARRLGDAYRAHQDDDLAVAAYERYLELDPAAPDAEEVRAAVEQLRSGSPLAR